VASLPAAYPEHGGIDAGTILPALPPFRFPQPLGGSLRPGVLELDRGDLSQAWEQSSQHILGQSRVLTKWEEEVEARGLGTLEVENLGVEGNVRVGTIGEDLISQGFVEGEPLRPWGKYAIQQK
jgi:hypothetical protein